MVKVMRKGAWKLFFKLVLKPLLGFMVLTLWTVAVATGMIDVVLFSAWITASATVGHARGSP